MDVLLRLGSQCNQKCLFCNVPKSEFINTSQALLRMKEFKTGAISITGGEPTIRTDVFKLIREASKVSSIGKVGLQTNAVMASYDGYALKLKEAGLDFAAVSFHSHDENISNRLTQSSFWKKTVIGIRNLISAGITVILNPVINKLNYPYLGEYVDFVAREFKGIELISFSFVQPNGLALENKWIVPTYTEVQPHIEKAVGLCKQYGIRYINPYCGFPMCLFPEPEKSSLEFIDEVDDGLEKKSLKRVEDAKVKPVSCEECVFDDRCNGVWENYAKIHGTNELKPVKPVRLHISQKGAKPI